jgi:hypothetical protein
MQFLGMAFRWSCSSSSFFHFPLSAIPNRTAIFLILRESVYHTAHIRYRPLLGRSLVGICHIGQISHTVCHICSQAGYYVCDITHGCMLATEEMDCFIVSVSAPTAVGENGHSCCAYGERHHQTYSLCRRHPTLPISHPAPGFALVASVWPSGHAVLHR